MVYVSYHSKKHLLFLLLYNSTPERQAFLSPKNNLIIKATSIMCPLQFGKLYKYVQESSKLYYPPYLSELDFSNSPV